MQKLVKKISGANVDRQFAGVQQHRRAGTAHPWIGVVEKRLKDAKLLPVGIRTEIVDRLRAQPRRGVFHLVEDSFAVRHIAELGQVTHPRQFQCFVLLGQHAAKLLEPIRPTHPDNQVRQKSGLEIARLGQRLAELRVETRVHHHGGFVVEIDHVRVKHPDERGQVLPVIQPSDDHPHATDYDDHCVQAHYRVVMPKRQRRRDHQA